MTTYDWHSTYREAVETFGGTTPGAELEQQLLETFAHSPKTIVTAISKAAAAYKAGKITSPWGIVRSELGRISSQPALTVTDTTSREKRIAQAEAWIRHTGLFLAESEIVADLFAPPVLTPTVEFLEQLNADTKGRPGRILYGPLLQAAIRRTREHGPEAVPNTGGLLTPHDTPALRQRMAAVWREEQERAERQQRERDEWAEKWNTIQVQLRKEQQWTNSSGSPDSTKSESNSSRWPSTNATPDGGSRGDNSDGGNDSATSTTASPQPADPKEPPPSATESASENSEANQSGKQTRSTKPSPASTSASPAGHPADDLPL